MIRSHAICMKTFGKRQYSQIVIDPWAKSRPAHNRAAGLGTVLSGLRSSYLAGLLLVCAIAAAGLLSAGLA
ncbi:MAG: hypothetical protein RLZZ444_2547 [Pseudomonadota bacterium]